MGLTEIALRGLAPGQIETGQNQSTICTIARLAQALGMKAEAAKPQHR